MNWTRTLASVVLPALVAAAPLPSAAQTENAGTPVLATHPAGEALPTLIRDGRGGAFVGLQTVVPASGGFFAYSLTHVARLFADGTRDDSWLPAGADSMDAMPGDATHLARVGDDQVWAISGLQRDPGSLGFHHFMSHLGPTGDPDPSVLVSRSTWFRSEAMQVVSQADGNTLVLHSAPSAPGQLMVDRVAPDGTIEQSLLPFTFPFSEYGSDDVVAAVGLDGGGAIATVSAYNSTTGEDLHAIKLATDGSAIWSPASRPVCTAAWTPDQVSSVPDGAGGAYFAWRDLRSLASFPDVYVTRLLSDGSQAPGWPVNGRLVGVLTGDQSGPTALPDGLGGVWLIWSDTRTGVSNVYYTHVQGSGVSAAGFSISGRPLSADPGQRAGALAVTDGAGGFIAVWRDGRNGLLADIYGQHVLFDGSFAPGLAADGEPICTNAADQRNLALVDVGISQAVVAWQDNRTGDDVVYAASVPAGNVGVGVPGTHAPRLELARLGANPARGAIECTVTSADAGEVSVRLIDAAGRVVDARALPEGGSRATVRFTPSRPGLYFLIATQAGATATSRVAFVR